MIRYMVQTYKLALDGELRASWEEMVNKGYSYRREDVTRKMHYDLATFIQRAISERDMVQEFEPFAMAYVKQQYNAMCDAFEHSCVAGGSTCPPLR